MSIAFPVLLIGFFMIAILGIGLTLLGIYMVINDDSLEDTPKALWVIAILAFNILGFIAYLIFRSYSGKNEVQKHHS